MAAVAVKPIAAVEHNFVDLVHRAVQIRIGDGPDQVHPPPWGWS